MQSRDCPEAEAHHLEPPFPSCITDLIALGLTMLGLLCKGLSVAPLAESQKSAQTQKTGLAAMAAGMGCSPQLSPRSALA